MDSRKLLLKSIESLKHNLENMKKIPASLLLKNIENLKKDIIVEVRRLEELKSKSGSGKPV
jgi:hypothetical protein